MVYGNIILQCLNKHNLISIQYVEYLINLDTLNDQLVFRDMIYTIINKFGLVDKHYDYGMKGIEILYKTHDNKNIIRIERQLEDFLLAAGNSKNLVKLFDTIKSRKWLDFQYHNFSEESSFVSRLKATCIVVYEKNPALILNLLHLINDVTQLHILDDFKELFNFFLETGTDVFAARYMTIQSYSEYRILEQLFRIECFDFLFHDYEIEKISNETTAQLVHFLHYSNKQSIAEELRQQYISATGEADPLAISNQKIQQIEIYESKKLLNDIKFIKNQQAFKEGIRIYFDVLGQDTLIDRS